jgi:hypothetical protein
MPEPVVSEVATDIYRISVFVPEINLQFNHFLVKDEEPLLFHTGLKSRSASRASRRVLNVPTHFCRPPM